MNGRTIFWLSIIGSLLFLALERLVGIGLNFHPDANTYLTTSNLVVTNIYQNPTYIINHGYYLWTYLLSGSEVLLIGSNMIIYASTNFLLHRAYIENINISTASQSINRKMSYVIFILFLFSLYRLHLSVHILKDTIIIFFSVLLFSSKSRMKLLWLIPITIFRVFGITYFVLFLRGRVLYLFIFLTLVASYLSQDYLTVFLLEFNEAEMDFREGTSIPSFQDQGLLGVFMRMIAWPILIVSGLFVFISPSPLYIPIALTSFVLQWWSFSTFRRPALTIGAYGLLAVLAALVPGFTSYQRYCLPIITMLPVIVLTCPRNFPQFNVEFAQPLKEQTNATEPIYRSPNNRDDQRTGSWDADGRGVS